MLLSAGGKARLSHGSDSTILSVSAWHSSVECWEPGMRKIEKTSRVWKKPQITRLGEMPNVRGSTGIGTQGVNNHS
jgi:hypothetical protein